MKYGNYSLYLNKVRKNLAAPGKLLLRCSTTYVPVGDQPTLFAMFSLSFVPSMQNTG